jgi:carboxypeptidase PM20D1
LERTIRGILPDTIVAPYLVVVVTDARYYAGLSQNVFRFLPLRLTPKDLDRMHGTDERIAVTQYENAIRTYRQLIVNAGGR